MCQLGCHVRLRLADCSVNTPLHIQGPLQTERSTVYILQGSLDVLWQEDICSASSAALHLTPQW